MLSQFFLCFLENIIDDENFQDLCCVNEYDNILNILQFNAIKNRKECALMRYLTSESHGPQLTVIIEGVPANLEIKAKILIMKCLNVKADMDEDDACKSKKMLSKLYLV